MAAVTFDDIILKYLSPVYLLQHNSILKPKAKSQPSNGPLNLWGSAKCVLTAIASNKAVCPCSRKTCARTQSCHAERSPVTVFFVITTSIWAHSGSNLHRQKETLSSKAQPPSVTTGLTFTCAYNSVIPCESLTEQKTKQFRLRVTQSHMSGPEDIWLNEMQLKTISVLLLLPISCGYTVVSSSDIILYA